MTDKSRLVSLLILCAIAVVFSVFSWLVPYQCDDISFMTRYSEFAGGSDKFSIGAIANYVEHLREIENGRLPQIIAPIMTLFIPKWIVSLITGIIVSVICWLILKLVDVSFKHRPFALCVILFAFLLFVPFRDNSMINAITLNYIYPSFFILLLFYLLKAYSGNSLKLKHIVAIVVVGLISGWLHEGFSVPLCVGFGCWIIKNKFKVPMCYWLGFSACVVGTFIVISAPSIINRVSNELNGMLWQEKFYTAVVGLPLVWCLLAGLLTMIIIRYRMFISLSRNPVLFIMAISSFISALITLMVNSAIRACWPAELYALICIMIICKKMSDKIKVTSVERMLTIASLIVIFGLFTNVLRWQYRLLKQHNEICHLMELSKNGTIYYDLMDIEPMRLPCLYLPVKTTWRQLMQYTALNMNYTNDNKIYAVVPSLLAGYDERNIRHIGGTGQIDSYNGILLTKNIEVDKERYVVGDRYYNFIDEANRSYLNVKCMKLLFYTPTGDVMAYIYPYKAKFEAPIVHADIVE